MGRKGIIGNWQQTKYVSRETSGSLPLVPWTNLEFPNGMMDGVDSTPFANTAYRVWDFQIPNQMMGEIEKWDIPNGASIDHGFGVTAYIRACAYWWINDGIGAPEEWETGIAQNTLFTDWWSRGFMDFGTPPPSYGNGFEPLSAFEMQQTRTPLFYKLGNQLNFSPQFDLYMTHEIFPVSPAPSFNYGNPNILLSGGSEYDGRGIYNIMVCFVYEPSL